MPASRLVAALALSTLLLAAGCAPFDETADPPASSATTSPASDSPQVTRATPGGRWSGLKDRCPTLTSAAAKRLNVSGPGDPGDRQPDGRFMVTARCAWGPISDRGQSGVDVAVTVFVRDPTGGDVTEQATSVMADALDELREEAAKFSDERRIVLVEESTPGDQAATVLDPASRSASLTVRSDNAIVSVTIHRERSWESRMPVVTEQLRQLRPELQELAGDVLDDLR